MTRLAERATKIEVKKMEKKSEIEFVGAQIISKVQSKKNGEGCSASESEFNVERTGCRVLGAGCKERELGLRRAAWSPV
jgi:hypothetical protein